ncbi:nitrilase-related carbon-nitrogen hydrolase [Candidatus Phytoplasma solani]|uniref:nitrilase-related carbon-nitrogen hydrolase n=1 Tax=Candidatus Phytoplasma solani TaxID=69896 RepID=UPI00358F972B
MYKNGSVKVQLSSPNLTVGNPLKNAYSINEVLMKSKASFVVFPELCLSSYTASDLFFETTFLKENLSALAWLLKNNPFAGVFIVGMPLALHEVLFNVAVIIQKDKILGIVPKKTIPNYKEFSEKRWFQSGKTCESQEITILDQIVPFGDILFINYKYDVIFGVEICQDLWTVFSPSDLLTLNGAHLIFNLSSSTEHIGKVVPRRIAVLDHSRKQIGGYFYTSSGITEISEANLFSNHKMAAVTGQMIGELDLFNQKTSLVVDVDLDLIKYQRRIDTTYGDQRIGQNFPFLKAFFQIQENDDYDFERPISQTPFINNERLSYQLKLANEIQTLALKTKLNNCDFKIVLEMNESLNNFLSLKVVCQSLALLQKSLQDLIIILKPQAFTNLNHYQLLKDFLQEYGIKNIYENSFPNDQKQQKVLLLESDNFSELALGKTSTRNHYDYVYNVVSGLPNVLIKELSMYHLAQDFWFNYPLLKEIYIDKAQNLLTEQKIIEDFILLHHIKNGFEPHKIAWLLQKAFHFELSKSQKLVETCLKLFHQSQFKRQNMAPGPKILENSLSPKSELRLPIDLQRQLNEV